MVLVGRDTVCSIAVSWAEHALEMTKEFNTLEKHVVG